MKIPVLLALGSNLGMRARNLARALAHIHDIAPVESVSPVYASASILRDDQPSYYNLVAEARTDLPPERLLSVMKSIEARMGRAKRVHWGPRIIDIDIIDYDGHVIRTENLTIPHPEMARRSFVLEPLADIRPDYVHPETGDSLSVMRDAIRDTLDIIQVGGVAWPY